ncbi:FecR family protein [Pseudoflavitalea sp. X16]|uniref:FecR family protein n=1 Tax=Paraflavitalea devenefica TaxID=2716334 RepID=UPI0014211854|nr:FecR family protein [Paraflavitalea devenefica]NII27493.1 FecR family protein [Paraflavitalea devenefica]
MNENNQLAVELILKHLREELTEPEKAQLNQWIKASARNEAFFLSMTDEASLHATLREYAYAVENIQGKQPTYGKVVRLNPGWPRKLAIAASFIALISICAYLFLKPSLRESPNDLSVKPQQQPDLLPGSQKATLTLGERVIVLADIKNGLIPQSAGIQKRADGELLYDGSTGSLSNPSNAEVHTLATPKGGYYKLILPDKTVVWLNAASSIRYIPSNFTRNRTIELTGEAYFEVAKMVAPGTRQAVPFYVKSGDATVQVLGTKFNISNYPEDKKILTSLLEGSVKVSSAAAQDSRIIVPGQQAIIQNDPHTLSLKAVDAENIISWTRQQFFFDNIPLSDVIHQLQRWYDIEAVQYEQGVPVDKPFYGKMQRNLPLSVVLPQLEAIGGISIELQGKSLHVKQGMP